MVHNISAQMTEIVAFLEKTPEGLSRGQIAKSLYFYINNKTLQRRLFTLLE